VAQTLNRISNLTLKLTLGARSPNVLNIPVGNFLQHCQKLDLQNLCINQLMGGQISI